MIKWLKRYFYTFLALSPKSSEDPHNVFHTFKEKWGALFELDNFAKKCFFHVFWLFSSSSKDLSIFCMIVEVFFWPDGFSEQNINPGLEGIKAIEGEDKNLCWAYMIDLNEGEAWLFTECKN